MYLGQTSPCLTSAPKIATILSLVLNAALILSQLLFVRSAADILDIRKILDEFKCHSINIIAKIENLQGVQNIDEIIRVSDGIMVARGDMGVEIPLEDVPVIQKMIIHKVYTAGKQVITATQMLESMIKNPRPTRAEATDVANAIYDGTSAIMLSGETAAGLYPVESVKTMARIAQRAEDDIDYVERFKLRANEISPDVTNAISHATCTTAHDIGASSIITVTKSGATARMISKYRPNCPIIGCSTFSHVCRQLNLSWGVIPLLLEEKSSTDDLFSHAVDEAEKAGLCLPWRTRCHHRRRTPRHFRHHQYDEGTGGGAYSHQRTGCYFKECLQQSIRL